MFNKILSVVVALCIVVIAIVQVTGAVKKSSQTPIGTSLQDRIDGYFVGSSTVSSTLTALFSGNRSVMNSKYMENLHLDFSYQPLGGQTNRYAEILIEGSNDNGVTYFPMGSKVVGTSEIDLYVTSTTGYPGLPIVIPGNKTTVGATIYTGTYDTDIMADHVRVSARESGSASFGAIQVYGVLSSK